MRFLLFDRVTHLEPGRRIEGVKHLSLTEEFLRGHFGKRPLVPGSLITEAMVQLTAWCAIAAHDYKYSLVLSMLDDVHLPAELGPGHALEIHGEIVGTNPKGSIGRVKALVDGEEVATLGRVLYAHFEVPDPERLRERFRYLGGTL